MAFIQQSIPLDVNVVVATGGTFSTLVAAPAPSASDITPKRVRVLSAILSLSVAGTITVKSSDGTYTTGPIYVAANTPLVLPYSADGWFWANWGFALQITSSVAATIGGSVNYVTE